MREVNIYKSTRLYLSRVAGAARPGPGIEARQRGVVEDMSRRVTHFLHRQPDAARRFIQAFVALPVGGSAHARNQRQRAFEHANDLADRDVSGSSREHIAATAPQFALQQSVARQVEKNRLEELLRQPLPIGELACLQRALARIDRGQLQHRLQAVLRLLREHAISLAD